MHLNPAFRDEGDRGALLDRAEAIGFAHLFAATRDGPMVAQTPVTHHGDAVRFHVARGNRLTPHLNGARVLLSLAEPHGYVSPNWYQRPGDQVPTWNYVGLEIEGTAHAIDEAALVEQLDALAARHEPRVNPAAPWTRGKMDDGVFRTMLRAICGFALMPDAIRTTTKLSQNKPDADRAGVVAELRAGGNGALAEAMAAAGRR